MRKNAYMLLPLAVLQMACNAGPVSYLVATPAPSETAYACALRKLNELGYTVTNANKEAGFIAGDKQTSGIGTQLLTGQQYHDQLTVSIFDAAAGAGRKIRATSGKIAQSSNIFGSSQKGVAPSDKGKADANDLLLACGTGPVSKQEASAYAVERRAVGQ